jgi:hypothetical protein
MVIHKQLQWRSQCPGKNAKSQLGVAQARKLGMVVLARRTGHDRVPRGRVVTVAAARGASPSAPVSGQVQTQVNAIWQKRLVLEKMFPTPPRDPSIDAKSPCGFRSPCGRGCYLLPTSPIKAMPLV